MLLVGLTLTFTTRSRDGLFGAGRAIGSALRAFRDAVKAARPTVVTLGGDFKTGKSVIAFGLDSAYRPELYARGLDQKRGVDAQLAWNAANAAPVIFENFLRKSVPKDAFEEGVRDFAGGKPGVEVAIISNFQCASAVPQNYPILGLASDALDLHVHVYEIFAPEDEKQSFPRRVSVTARERTVIRRIAEAVRG